MKIAIICPSKDMTCGIGNYSQSLSDALKSRAEVLFTNSIDERVLDFGPDVVSFQWEYGLYDNGGTTTVLNILRKKGIYTTITLHGWSDYDTKNKIIETMFDGYIVLNQGLRQKLLKRGVEKPIHVIPMGMQEYGLTNEDRELVRDLLGIGQREIVVGAFGFLEPYKNFHAVIEALSQIRGVSFLLCSYSKESNDSYALDLQRLASNLGIRYMHLSGYMNMNSVVKSLHSCDALVYAYIDVFTYSSSAAIRTGISSLVPVIASDITFFEDIPDLAEEGPVYKAKNGLVEAINNVLADEKIRSKLKSNAQAYIKQNTWDNVANSYLQSSEYLCRPL